MFRDFLTIQGNSVLVTIYDTDSWLGYTGVGICLAGVVLGVEGFRRPSSQKVFAIAGALMNTSLLIAIAAAVSLYWFWFH